MALLNILFVYKSMIPTKHSRLLIAPLHLQISLILPQMDS